MLSLVAGATLLPRASAGRYAALPTPQAQVAGPTAAEAASDVLRAIYDPKLNEGTLAGQAAEFMSIMSHKVSRCSVATGCCWWHCGLFSTEACSISVLANIAHVSDLDSTLLIRSSGIL